MKKKIKPATLGLLLSLLPFLSYPQENQTKKKLAGSYAGALEVQGIELRHVVNFRFNEADSMIVTLDSPDQGAKDIPTSKVIIREDSEKPLTLNRPQEPKPPLPYRSTDVVFHNSQGGIDLSGTLTLPEKEGKYPVAILVTGSGAQNRDEELMGHKPFLLMADYLTRQGMAVLRFDDRGVGKSGGTFKTATTLDFAADANAAVEFLKTHPEIDTSRIGLIGHSEGGLEASIVASVRPDVAFIILMAVPGLIGEKILLTQSAQIAQAAGASDTDIKEAEKINKDIYSVLKKNKDNEQAAKKIRAIFASIDKKHAADTGYRKISEAALSGQIETLTSPWFRCYLTLDPEDYLTKVKCPILAINGSLDLQVASKENLEAIEKALIFGGNPNYITEELPGLNHLFQTAKTGSPSEYGQIEETISPVALELIGKWVEKNLTKE